MVNMDASKITSKTSSLKALILKAWRERWTDIQWGINIKTILPRGVSGDLYNLADCILQQAMVGCGANQLVISYLKHSLASHLVSYAAVLQRISKFDAFHKPHCIISLLDFLESFLDNITCRGKLEEEVLAVAISSIILWLLQVYHYVLSKYPSSNPIQSQELLEKSTSLLNSVVNSDFLLAMFYLAKQNDQDELFNEVTKKCKEITGFMMMNTQFKAPVTIHETLQKICNMEVDKIAPLNTKTESVTHMLQATIAMNVLADPSADLQQISSQLLMVQRIKGYSLSRLYCEIIRACFICLNDSSKDATRQALWAAFTFLKLPQVIHYIHNLCGTNSKEGEHSAELVAAFETLLQSTPLLDIVDTKNSCNSVVSLLESLVKLNVVTDAQVTYFSQKRESKELKLEKLEPTGLVGPVPHFISSAEPSLNEMLNMLAGDFNKTQDSLYPMLCKILAPTNLVSLLAVATVEGKMKLFVSRLIKFNDFALVAASEKGAPQVKVNFFDISFLILCSIIQEYGADTVLDEKGESFFEQWVRDCMPTKGVPKPPEEIIQKSDQPTVELLLHQLSSSDDFLNTTLKPQELFINVCGIVKEVLFAWEQESMSVNDVKRILESLRQKITSLAVCASVWICSYINVVDHEAISKPVTMLEQLLASPNEIELKQIDNCEDRSALMCQIIRKMQDDIQPSTAKAKPSTYSHNVVSRLPIFEQLQSIWEDIKSRGYLHTEATQTVKSLLSSSGSEWFVINLVKELLKYRYQDDLDRSVDVVLAMFNLDIKNSTETLLLTVLPEYLYGANLSEELVEPQSAVLAKLAVYCIYAALENSNSNKVHNSRKRRHDESDDMEGSSNKMRRLNDNSTDSTGSNPYSQSQTSGVSLKEPLLTTLEALFTLFSELAGKNGDVTPQTHFILQFLVYLVQSGTERAHLVLQKMPNELVPTLIKALPDCFNVNVILRLYDLSTSHGRKDTARDLCLLRNMRLRPD